MQTSGAEVHSKSPALKFMKENYRKSCQARPQQGEASSSRVTSNDSMVMVPENTWEDIKVEDDQKEKENTVAIREMRLKDFPPGYRQHQGKMGNTDKKYQHSKK